MKTNIPIPGLLLGAFLVGLSGCASYPVSKNLKEQAKPLTLAQVTSNPGSYTGTIVIWGGRVIQTVNDTNGGNIYVLQLPLDSHGRPDPYGASTGRFVARGKNFIDPEVFKKGRLITVAGAIAGVETQPLQKVQFAYPVMDIRELHLWQPVPSPYYYYYPGWYGGWYGPGWGWDGPGWGWYGPGWY